MNSLPLAFLMGLLGSLHCAVMCGPLMLSLPLQKTGFFSTAFQLLLYQLGRVLVYTLLGALVGWIGSSFAVFANQEILSLTIGLLLVLFTLLQLNGHHIKSIDKLQQKIIAPLSRLMAKFYGSAIWGFFAGLLNGLLPCGMVYLALATALNTASLQEGTTFMFLFGIGTMPLMLMISLGGIYLKKYIKFNTQRLVPYFMLFIGTLLILRSAELDIPFLSPSMSTHAHNNVAECR